MKNAAITAAITLALSAGINAGELENECYAKAKKLKQEVGASYPVSTRNFYNGCLKYRKEKQAHAQLLKKVDCKSIAYRLGGVVGMSPMGTFLPDFQVREALGSDNFGVEFAIRYRQDLGGFVTSDHLVNVIYNTCVDPKYTHRFAS